MTVDVRTVTDEEFAPWVAAVRAGFLSQASEGEAEMRRVSAHLDRTWAAFAGDRIVGTLRSWPAELTVPGGRMVPVDALTNVTVSPTHRRQGLLTRMIVPDLEAAKEAGEVASILIAAEYPIYGRFGYGPATENIDLVVDARAATFTSPRPAGSMELADLAELRKVGPALYERNQARQPGAITRTDRWWDLTCQIVSVPDEEPYKGFVAISRDAGGEPDGYVRYKADVQWTDGRANATLEVTELLATTPEAYTRLWRYCCEVDWVATVKAADRYPNEPLRWMLADARVLTETGLWDFMWLRPLDVPALLSARQYLTPGEVVIEVTDPQGLASGRFLLDGGPDGASCTPTTRTAGLTLGVGELGSVVLGGGSLRSIAYAGRVDGHDEAALATADAMFRGAVTPWCTTWF